MRPKAVPRNSLSPRRVCRSNRQPDDESGSQEYLDMRETPKNVRSGVRDHARGTGFASKRQILHARTDRILGATNELRSPRPQPIEMTMPIPHRMLAVLALLSFTAHRRRRADPRCRRQPRLSRHRPLHRQRHHRLRDEGF